MINKNLNNQHTLYRIVSLRNPEKSNIEKQETRFVFYFDNEKEVQSKGQFIRAVKSKADNQTKWQALTNFANEFRNIAYNSETDVENINKTFFETANWLARNRSIAQPQEIATKINGLTKLEDSIESNLWDNLFYAVVTDKNLYLKEAVMQMLVLQNLLKQKPTLENIISLANANVVLPPAIFEEEVISTNNESINAARERENQSPDFLFAEQPLTNAQEIAQAKNQLQFLETTKIELQKTHKKAQLEYQKRFDNAQKEHQSTTKPLIDEYQKKFSEIKFKLETEAQTNKDINVNLVKIDYPSIPEFIFEEQSNVFKRELLERLSENGIKTIQELENLDEIESFEDLYHQIDENIASVNKKIIENTEFSTKSIVFGDVVFPAQESRTASLPSCQICVSKTARNITFSFTIQVPSNITSLSAVDLVFIAQNGDRITKNSAAGSLSVSNVINFGMTIVNNLDNGSNPIVGLEGTMYFFGHPNYTFNLKSFDTIIGCKPPFLLATRTANSQTSNIALKGFGFRQIGIADHKKVVTEICGYRAGEVAHIENVLAGETREKVTTKTHKSEVTNFQGQETESEKMSDTVSTERFEMQTEIAKMQQEQSAFDAHANVHSSWGNTTLDAGANYATNTSKEESNRQAVTQAKEQTQRAMERIVSRTKNEKTVKITDEFIEANKHRFENLNNPNNVSGVYRFINAVYKNQIYNYGKRLMYEFMVPEPSKLHRLGLSVSTADKNAVLISKPVDPRTTVYNNFSTIDKNNYKLLIATYDAQNVKIYPDFEIFLNKSFCNATDFNSSASAGVSENFNIEIPEGYETIDATINADSVFIPIGHNHSFGVSLGNMEFFRPTITNDSRTLIYDSSTGSLDSRNQRLKKFRNNISASYHSFNNFGFNIAISIKCQLTQEATENWQKETYEAIIAGYNAQLETYNQNLAALKAQGTALLDSNPLFYRQTEQLVLRKNCISYLLDNSSATTARRFGQDMNTTNDGTSTITFGNHQIATTQKMDDYTSFAKFMEQAFEWNLMSYNFYPFYWGNNADWKDLYQFETNDPTYRAFMQAGMARVVVTVKPGFESAVMHYMAFGQIWNGGQTPVLGNPLYLSIVDELKEQEYYIEDVWETVVPTNLVALQETGVSIAGGGLPNADSCLEHADKLIQQNNNIVGNPAQPKE